MKLGNQKMFLDIIALATGTGYLLYLGAGVAWCTKIIYENYSDDKCILDTKKNS
jgi:hypothetical protein